MKQWPQTFDQLTIKSNYLAHAGDDQCFIWATSHDSNFKAHDEILSSSLQVFPGCALAGVRCSLYLQMQNCANMFSVVERQAAPVPHCACLPGSPSLIPGQVSTTCKHSTPLLLTVAALCTHYTTHGSTPRHRQLVTSVPIQNWFHYITSSRNMRTRFLQCSNHSFLLCIRWRIVPTIDNGDRHSHWPLCLGATADCSGAPAYPYTHITDQYQR